MATKAEKSRKIVGPESAPMLAKHVKLKHNKIRDQWVLLGPERLLEPDEPALAILKRYNGVDTIDEIAKSLAREYQASAEEICKDVVLLSQDLADKGFLLIASQQ